MNGQVDVRGCVREGMGSEGGGLGVQSWADLASIPLLPHPSRHLCKISIFTRQRLEMTISSDLSCPLKLRNPTVIIRMTPGHMCAAFQFRRCLHKQSFYPRNLFSWEAVQVDTAISLSQIRDLRLSGGWMSCLKAHCS